MQSKNEEISDLFFSLSHGFIIRNVILLYFIFVMIISTAEKFVMFCFVFFTGINTLT